MENICKRFTALLLAMAMCLSLLSANVWADNDSEAGNLSVQGGDVSVTKEVQPQTENSESEESESESEESEIEPDESEPNPDVSESNPEESESNPDVSESEPEGEETAPKEYLKDTTVDEPEPEQSKLESASEADEARPAGEETAAQVEDVTRVTGSCGNGVTYVLQYRDESLTDGTLSISGTGAMADYRITDTYASDKFPFTSAPWSNSNVFEITSVSIGGGISHIGDYAFCGAGGVSSVEVAGSVTSIGTGAFWGCGSLQELTLPDGLASIGTSAFYYCTNLHTIHLPESTSSIERSAFYQCKNLQDVYFGGTEEQWNALVASGIDDYRNESLLNATVHFASGNVSLWEDESAASRVRSLTWSGGNFFWSTADGTDVYDHLYLKVAWESKDELQKQADTVEVSLPEGFSFQADTMTRSKTLTLTAGEGMAEIFPIYAEQPDAKALLVDLTFSDSATGSVVSTQSSELASLSVNADSGKVLVAEGKYADGQLEAAWFDRSSYIYNHALGASCATLSAMAYRSDADIRTSWRNLGFSDVHLYRSKEDDADLRNTVDFSIARKRLYTGDKVNTIVAVSMRGTSTPIEWASNVLTVGLTEHKGFEKSKENTAGILWTYLLDRGIDANNDASLRLLFTGHSRAASAANLLAADYDDAAQSRGSNAKNVYCYTFATPNCTKANDISAVRYKNIFNFTYDTDIAPSVAPRALGYNKYGITYLFPSPFWTRGYNDAWGPMVNEQYGKYTGKAYDPITFEDYAMLVLNAMSLFAPDIPPTAEKYTLKWAGQVARQLGVKLSSAYSNLDSASHLVPKILCAHDMLGYLSWMEVTTGEANLTRNKANYKVLRVACPVDVEVRDSAGAVVARIKNDVVDESCHEVASMAYEGVKFVILPRTDTYKVTITATDDGTMAYSVFEYDEDGMVSRSVNEYDINLTKGMTFTGSVSPESGASCKSYQLTASDRTTIEPSLDINETKYADVEDVEALVPELIAQQARYGTVEVDPAWGNALATGGAGEDATWTFYENGTMVFAGKGRLDDHHFWWTWDGYEANDIPWSNCKDGAPTSDEYGATDYRSRIKNVVFSEGITYIGSYTFWGCSKIKSITLPSTLTGVGESGLASLPDCKGLYLPEGLTSIGKSAFSGSALSGSITVPDAVTVIPDNAFSGCSGVTSIELHEGITSIGENAFANTSLRSLSIPDSVTSLGKGFMSGCDSLLNLKLGGGITEIPDDAFKNVKHLLQIELSEGITRIGEWAFANNPSLTKVKLPNSLLSVGYAAFYSCTSLRTVEFGSGLQEIGGEAFYQTSIVHLQVPEHVWYIGREAFYGCTRLKDASIPDSVTEMGSRVFAGCSELETVTLGDGLTTIPEQTFVKTYTSSLKRVVLGKNIKRIESRAFYACNQLEEIELPAALDFIGSSAFEKCSSLTSIVIPDSVTEMKSQAFYDCSSLASIKLGSGLTRLNGYTFEYCGALKEIEIPGNIETVGNAEFYYCGNLTRVVVQEGVTSIGDNCFKKCGALVDVSLPDSLENLGAQCFVEDTSLREIVLPDKIQVLKGDTFSQCTSLEKVTLGSGLRVIDSGETYYGHGVFDRTALKEIVIPAGVQSIGQYVFAYCKQLRTVTFEGDAPFFGDKCFLEDNVFAFYPADNDTWDEDVMQDYGGKSVTWHVVHDHVAAEAVRENESAVGCTTDGKYDSVVYCSECGFELSRELITVPATGHKLGKRYTMLYDGNAYPNWYPFPDIHAAYCDVCGHSVDEPHDFALLNEKGDDEEHYITRTYQCTKCGYEKTETTRIPYLEMESDSVYVGDRMQLTWYYRTGEGTVTWSSSNAKAAAVSADGVVKGVAPGKSTITATADGESISCTITVKAIPHLSQTTVSMHVGELVQLMLYDSPGKVIWSSEDEYAVTVSADGLVKATSCGTVNVYATVDDMEYLCTVTVHPLVNTITASDFVKSYSTKQQKVKLKAKANGVPLYYTSGDQRVYVDENGKVTIPAKFSGTVKITIYADETDVYGWATKTVTITVPKVTNVKKATAGKGKMTVQWKKNTTATDYEVQYSTDKKFKKKNKTVKVKKQKTVKTTIKKLKKGIYYVRIRTLNGKCTSDWSKAKTVTVK